MRTPFVSLGTAFAVALTTVTASAEITSRSYVQSGLVAQYDGIDNAGYDQHSDSASAWVNLTGNTALNGTVNSNVTWSANGWSVNANCKPITVGNALSAITGTGTFTIQFACSLGVGQNSGRQAFFSQYNASRSFGIEHRGTTVTDCIRLYSASRDTSLSSKPSGLVVNEWGSITVAADNGMRDVLFYRNLTPWGERHFAASATLNTDCQSVIGGETLRDNMAFHGTYNAFRVYDRVLTEEEVKINAAVDAVRFNGKTWDDYPELAAYSFAADGTLQANFIATATDGGTVSIDGGTAATAANATFAYGSDTQTHSFAAVPNSGYVFYRWTGDTDAIAEGTCLSPTITVSSKRAVSLTAVFKAPRRGLSSLSYVTHGLVALYDGKDNAGFNTHDPNARTWVDLTGSGNDGACADSSVFTWNADSWSVSGNCKPVTLGNGISAVTATGEFTIQFACNPLKGANGSTGRQCFFSQYTNDVKGIGVEHNGVVNRNELRFYSNVISGSAYSTSDPIEVNQWVQCSIAVSNSLTRFGFYKNGNPINFTTNKVFKKTTYASSCTSIIGGEPYIGRDMAFRGTYNAFRLYNRPLTADEIMVNAAVDAIRFNGKNTSDYTLGGGYSFAADDTLMVEVSAVATDGGKVALMRSGSFASSASTTVNQDGSEFVGFVAQADAGYVFQGWRGDTDAIIEGSALTAQIGVDSTRPVLLTAVFGKNGNALDGMALDVEFSSDGVGVIQNVSHWKIGNALMAGAEQALCDKAYETLYTSWVDKYPAGTPMFLSEDIPLPAAPYTTNAAQKCVYFPQISPTSTNLFAVRVEMRKLCITGAVSTFYVRFRWEGSVRPASENWCTILMNGVYGKDGLSKKGQGSVLRLQAPGGTSKGYLDVYVPGKVATDQDTGTDFHVAPNRWVDCFFSVYPSPTNGELSNADIWFCQTPAFSGGAFGKPVLKHRHLDDSEGLPKMTTASEIYSGIIMGSESSSELYKDADIFKAFRGSIAAVKGWKRLLTEAEMWSVMLKQHGGTFNVGVENGSADEFGAAGGTSAAFDPTADKWQTMKKSLTAADRTLTLEIPLTAENAHLPRVLEIVPLFDNVGASCPVTVAANGKTVGTFDLMNVDDRAISLRGGKVTRDANGKLTITITRPEGCAGTLSFDAISLGGSWQVGIDNNTSADMGDEAKGTPCTYVMGDVAYTNAQRALVANYKTLSLLFDVPKTSAGKFDYQYQCELSNVKRTATPAHIELNGATIWSSDTLAVGQVIKAEFAAGDLKPGLNELKWNMDASETDSFISFDYHRVNMIPPKIGTALSIR